MSSKPSDDDWSTEDPSRPFEQWLDDYTNSTATVDALGELGAKCRDAADRMVSELLATGKGFGCESTLHTITRLHDL